MLLFGYCVVTVLLLCCYCLVTVLLLCFCSPNKDADPIISEDVEKKFLGIVRYNVTEGRAT